ncbi:RNF213 [Mytilus edulis]|uniref:RNF213 n=1 Tax=Mytilus edulis TaxID=6550 RepID=A0A8S3QE08_MYTED|nr:RNF213 [Mytilus edulis]
MGKFLVKKFINPLSFLACGVEVAKDNGNTTQACPKCSSLITKRQKFCAECGWRIDRSILLAPKILCVGKDDDGNTCGAEIIPGEKFCPECGSDHGDQSSKFNELGARRKSKFVHVERRSRIHFKERRTNVHKRIINEAEFSIWVIKSYRQSRCMYFRKTEIANLQNELILLEREGNTRWIDQRLYQVEIYRNLKSCEFGAEAILEVVKAFDLQGDFNQIITISKCARGADTSMNKLDKSLRITCSALREVTKERAEWLKTFIRCKQLVDWLRESMPCGLKELKVFLDLASIFAGEGDMEIDKVKCIHTATIGYAPLIFNLEYCYTKILLDKCQEIWRELLANPTLPRKLIYTNNQLAWLQTVKRSHGSVEVSSFEETEAINTKGIYLVGNLKKIENLRKTARKICGEEIHQSFKFCLACGVEVAKDNGNTTQACPKCSSLITKRQKFCAECGWRIDRSILLAPKILCVGKDDDGNTCGAEIIPGDKFCPECGSDHGDQSSKFNELGSRRKSKFVHVERRAEYISKKDELMCTRGSSTKQSSVSGSSSLTDSPDACELYFRKTEIANLQNELILLEREGNTRWIDQRLYQVEIYRNLKSCEFGAEAILEVVKAFDLQGDFNQIITISKCARGADTSMNKLDKSLRITCSALREVTKERAEWLKTFIRCKQLVDWLRESMPCGLKELKVFLDLASIFAGEGDMEIDKIYTNNQLAWLQTVKRSHGSVEVSSFEETEAINTKGIYLVGNLKKIENLRKTASIVDILDGVVGLGNIYVKLVEEGCVLFSQWHVKFLCDRGRLACAFIYFGYGEDRHTLKGRVDESSQDVSAIIPKIAKFLEQCHENWLRYIDEKREKYYCLNFFTIDQMVILQQELVKIGSNQEPSALIYPLLSAVKQGCTREDLVRAMSAAKEDVEQMDRRRQEEEETKESDEEVMVEVEEPDEIKTSKFLQEMITAGYNMELAKEALKNVGPDDVDGGIVWCMDNEDDFQAMDVDEPGRKSPGLLEEQAFSRFTGWTQSGQSLASVTGSLVDHLGMGTGENNVEILTKALESLWDTFLTSISSSVSDYLSVEHLGMIL